MFPVPLFQSYLIHNNCQLHLSHYKCFCPNIRVANADECSDGQAERSRSPFLNLMTLGAQMSHTSLFRSYLIHNNCQFHLSHYKCFCSNKRIANADEGRGLRPERPAYFNPMATPRWLQCCQLCPGHIGTKLI